MADTENTENMENTENLNYEFTILHYNEVFPNRVAAKAWLHEYDHHLIGQFIQVLYEDNNGELRTILALGTKNYTDDSEEESETVNSHRSNTSSNKTETTYYEIISDTGDDDDDDDKPETDLAKTTVNMGGVAYEVASYDKEKQIIKDPLKWDKLNIDVEEEDNKEYAADQPRAVFKDYEGTIEEFKALLDDLAKNAADGNFEERKLNAINSSVVFIHNSDQKGTHIYANGRMFTFDQDITDGSLYKRTWTINGTTFEDFASTSNRTPILNDPFEWKDLNKSDEYIEFNPQSKYSSK